MILAKGCLPDISMIFEKREICEMIFTFEELAMGETLTIIIPGYSNWTMV